MNTKCPKCQTLIDWTGTAGRSFGCPGCGAVLRSPEPAPLRLERHELIINPSPRTVLARPDRKPGPPTWLLAALGSVAGALILGCGGCVVVTALATRAPVAPVAQEAKPPAQVETAKANVEPVPEWTADELLCLEAYESNSFKEFGSATKIGDIGFFSSPVEVFQVTGARSLLARKVGLNLFCIEGVPTAEFVDGKRYEFKDVFLVDGTYRYATSSGGTKQVLLFRRISTAKVHQAIAEKTLAEIDEAKSASD